MRLGLASALLALLAPLACRTPSNGSATLGDETQPAAAAAATKLRYLEYDVRFTNPVCKQYDYAADQNVATSTGQVLQHKPVNVFCTQQDSPASGSRPEAPQQKLLSWINDPATKEIFFAYLSFSNKTVMKALCEAIKTRNVKVQWVMDTTSDASVPNELLNCAPGNGDANLKPKMYLRGHEGGIGYAHNKMFLINPGEGQGQIKIAFSSGNMTSGIVLHHENWHFITPERDTYFAQSHLCLMKGVLDHHGSTTEYGQFIKQCKQQIPYPEETDIKAFFVPGEGPRATKFLTDAIKRSSQVRLAAHRFGYNKLIQALRDAAARPNPPQIQLVFDDDVWWAGHGEQVGDNESWEYDNAMSIVEGGTTAEARWMETNHAQHLLHHNKYLVLNAPEGGGPSAVFGGAGNLTGTGFNSNFENFYYVEIPEVVQRYNEQYDHVWNDMATPTDGLPATNALPPGTGG